MKVTHEMVRNYNKKREDGRLTSITAIVRAIIPSDDIVKIHSDKRVGPKLKRRYKVSCFYRIKSAEQICKKINSMIARQSHLSAVASPHGNGDIVIHVYRSKTVNATSAYGGKVETCSPPKDSLKEDVVQVLRLLELSFEGYKAILKKTPGLARELAVAYPRHAEAYGLYQKAFKIDSFTVTTDSEPNLVFIGAGLAPHHLQYKCLMLNNDYNWTILKEDPTEWDNGIILVPTPKQ
jgi:hypothetical protein